MFSLYLCTTKIKDYNSLHELENYLSYFDDIEVINNRFLIPDDCHDCHEETDRQPEDYSPCHDFSFILFKSETLSKCFTQKKESQIFIVSSEKEQYIKYILNAYLEI